MSVLTRIGGETNDCGVKAVAFACDVEYTVALRLLRLLGRPFRKGTPWSALEQSIPMLGYRATGPTEFGKWGAKDPAIKAKTIRGIASDPYFARGTFLVTVRRHILCVRDGVVLDWSGDSARRIQDVWQITKL